MNREKIHRGILRCLLSLRGRSVERVRLVSRFYNAELLGGDSVTHTFLFIPDLHLLSQRGEQRFRYGFQRLKKNRYVKRSVLLDQVCEKIVEYRTKTGLSLKTVQLGDIPQSFPVLAGKLDRGAWSDCRRAVPRTVARSPSGARRGCLQTHYG